MPIATLKHAIKRFLPEQALKLTWIKKDQESWLAKNLPERSFSLPASAQHRSFEAIAGEINRRGVQPLWDGYRAAYDKDSNVPWAGASMERWPDQVRTQPQMGRLFAWLAEHRKPEIIVEVGTAFGVSAMYWASGLQGARHGQLLTFDPNPVWHDISAAHLKSFGETVDAVCGTFEDNIDARLNGRKISLAFVDAIHTDEFVSRQVVMLTERMAADCIIVIDDIGFSKDMQFCWTRWASDSRVRSSVAIDNRVGILEFSHS